MKVNVLFHNGKRSLLKSKLAQHLQKAGKLTIEGDGYMTRHMEAGVTVPVIAVPEIIEEPVISASKAAQELAAENGIDLATIVGTGLHGNITKADVEKAINS